MIVDGCAGPGGWDEGARLAGYTGPLIGIEWDMAACRTAMAAGHTRVCADIATFPLHRLAGKVTGLIKSPPCPTWSTAGDGAGKVDAPNVYRLIADYAAGRTPGRYVWEDERSALTAQPMRWAVELAPRWIALEQVPPVLPIWQYIAEMLRKRGYRTWCGVLSAEEYGVPQTRKRAILMASLDGPVGPPEPTHQAYVSGRPPQTDDDLFGSPLPPPVSMAQALGWGLPAQPCPVVMTARGRQAGPSDVLRGSSWRADWWQRQLEKGNWISMAPAGATSTMVDPRPAATDLAHTITGKATAAWVLRNGPQENATERDVNEPAGTVYCSRPGNLAWVQTRPSTTVCGDARIGSPGDRDREGGERQFGDQSVRVTVQEAGVLQSFRADYPWQGTKTEQYRCVGDVVPPLLAKAILAPLLADADSRRVAA